MAEHKTNKLLNKYLTDGFKDISWVLKKRYRYLPLSPISTLYRKSKRFLIPAAAAGGVVRSCSDIRPLLLRSHTTALLHCCTRLSVALSSVYSTINCFKELYCKMGGFRFQYRNSYTGQKFYSSKDSVWKCN